MYLLKKKIEGSFIRKNHKYLHISGDENFLKQGKIANNIYSLYNGFQALRSLFVLQLKIELQGSAF